MDTVENILYRTNLDPDDELRNIHMSSNSEREQGAIYNMLYLKNLLKRYRIKDTRISPWLPWLHSREPVNNRKFDLQMIEFRDGNNFSLKLQQLQNEQWVDCKRKRYLIKSPIKTSHGVFYDGTLLQVKDDILKWMDVGRMGVTIEFQETTLLNQMFDAMHTRVQRLERF